MGRPPILSKRDEFGRKECRVCGEWKNVTEFGPSKITSDKLESRCKQCNLARENKRRTENKRYFLRALARSHRAHGKRGSKRRQEMVSSTCVSADFLEDLWVEQDGRCAVTGLKMSHIAGNGRTPTNVSIDRIDSSAGYQGGNVRLVCLQVNLMKDSLDDDGLRYWCRKVLRN